MTYIELLKELKEEAGVSIWAYCLMPNHVHFVAVPRYANSLARLFRQLHSQHAVRVNGTHGWSGHLWQERFYSVVMDEPHTYATMRYIELNPVRAGLCSRPQDWRWSSVHAHLSGKDDGIVDVTASSLSINCWHKYLENHEPGVSYDDIRNRTRCGRPTGSAEFLDKIEEATGRDIRRKKPGRRKLH